MSPRRKLPGVIRRRRQATGWTWSCKCERCGYEWVSRLSVERPTRCARCKSENFNRPARPYRRRKR
jgi:predicted Zn-ribbon and HTH transcriptional regulator